MSVVEDEDAKSGWAIDVKKAISQKEIADYLYVSYNRHLLLQKATPSSTNHDFLYFQVFFLTRNDSTDTFESNYAASFCRLFENGDDSLLPKQILNMIFPKQNDSCQFKVNYIILHEDI